MVGVTPRGYPRRLWLPALEEAFGREKACLFLVVIRSRQGSSTGLPLVEDLWPVRAVKWRVSDLCPP